MFTKFQNSGALFAQLIKAAPSAIVMIDRAGSIVLANLQAEKLFGYSENEILGQQIEILIPARFRHSHHGYRDSFFSNPISRSMGAGRDLFGCRKDGSEVSIEIGLTPIDSPEGAFVLASIIDITERKRAEEKFRLAVEAAPNAMIMVDSEGKMILANRQTETMFQYSRKELIGEPIEILVPNRFQKSHPGQRGSFFSNPKTRSMGAGRELFGKRKDSSEVAIEIGLNPIETSEGIYVLASIIDITERKKTEALIASQEAALEASRMKSQFLANMSHEIRTPMNGIIGMTELLSFTALDSQQADYAETIRRSAESLLTIINDILDFSKIEAGKLDLESEELDLDQLMRDVERVFSVLAEKKGITLFSNRPVLHRKFRGDSGRILQVLNNLLGNAIKFTEKGQVSIRVSLQNSDGKYTNVKFEIQDTGIGIPDVSRSDLFRAFSQADNSSTRKFGGTGLGLSISKRLVELMGGTIEVASEVGKGSNFSFQIKLENGSGSATKPEPLKDVALPTIQGHDRILVAEDHLINQKLVFAMLEKLGFKVDIVGNGKEALERISQNEYSLVLMDCQMPELDGFETTTAIRRLKDSKQSSIPVIAMTASAIKGDREKCIEVGMNDYISKPLHLSQLQEILEKWLNPKK